MMAEARLTVHEPRVKVDLTKYVEHHAFSFDDVLDEEVSNDAVYRSTVQPLVATIFRAGKVSMSKSTASGGSSPAFTPALAQGIGFRPGHMASSQVAGVRVQRQPFSWLS